MTREHFRLESVGVRKEVYNFHIGIVLFLGFSEVGNRTMTECLFKIMKTAAAANIHEKLFNRSFAPSGHIIWKKLCWDRNNAVGLSKQRNSYQYSPAFLCFESPNRFLRPGIIYSVPCDQMVQSAHSLG